MSTALSFFLARRRAVLLTAGALAIAGCSSQTPERSSSSTAQALAGTGALNPSEIVGAVSCGETVTYAYAGATAYAAYSFPGVAGEPVAFSLRGSTTAQADAWILRSDFTEVTSSGAAGSTSLATTLPKSETYYFAFRDKTQAADGFTVTMTCPTASDGGTTATGDGGATNDDGGAGDAGIDAAPACATGDTLCGSACVNESSDPNNCGACGVVCSGGEACTDGACACASGQTSCGGTCVDESSDPNNCGACGNACEASQTCSGGACTPPDPFSPSSCEGTPLTPAQVSQMIPLPNATSYAIGGYTVELQKRTCYNANGSCTGWTTAPAPGQSLAWDELYLDKYWELPASRTGNISVNLVNNQTMLTLTSNTYDVPNSSGTFTYDMQYQYTAPSITLESAWTLDLGQTPLVFSGVLTDHCFRLTASGQDSYNDANGNSLTDQINAAVLVEY